MLSEHISTEAILFLILYGITGAVPFMASIYLLLRRGNAFAPEVTPPVRLRRWAAAFFAVSALGHVWWMLFYIFSRDIHSVEYLVVVALDYVGMVTTIAGTMLSMLQDRKRPVWPALVAMIPFVGLGGLLTLKPEGPFLDIAGIYILSLYVLFSLYMVYAVRQYGRWLNDNYADLENKRVWLSQVVLLFFLLVFILYTLGDSYTILLYVLHFVQLALFGLLLWRVETLPQLGTLASPSLQEERDTPINETTNKKENSPLPAEKQRGGSQGESAININFAQIGQQLTEHCVDTRLYLQHDLTLAQLATAVGINRYYLSQYFSSQGMNYNTYINGLRINHFISRYHEVVAARQSFTVQQLAHDCGYRSYSTFSLAFKQRMGQSVTAWIRNTAQ